MNEKLSETRITGPSREMSLAEWTETLPTGHRARKELAALEARLEAMEQLVEQVGLAPVAPEIFIQDYNEWLSKLKKLAAAQEEQEDE